MLKNYKYGNALFWLAVFFLLPLPLLQLTQQELPALYSASFTAIQFGTIAYVWLLTAIYLASRPGWLDRLVGLPTTYMVHGIMGLLAIILALVHKLQLSSIGWIKRTGDWALYLLIGLAVYALVFMAGWLTSRVGWLAKLKHQLEHLFRHEISIWLHRLNLVAVLLVFIHVLLIDYIRNMRGYLAVFLLYTVVALGAYVWAYYSSRHTRFGKLLTNNAIAANVLQLTIQLPRWAPQPAPGDYLFIAFPSIAGLKEPHPFSVVSAPNRSKQVVFAIRGDGDFTTSLAKVPVGTTTQLSPSYGRFQNYLDEHPAVPVVAISGGIGIVPILSLIEGNHDRSMQVFYAARQNQNWLYPEKFAAWQKRSNFQAYLQKGRFTVAQVQAELSPATLQTGIFLLSGPPSMGRAWLKQLKAMGVDSWRIYYEAFAW